MGLNASVKSLAWAEPPPAVGISLDAVARALKIVAAPAPCPPARYPNRIGELREAKALSQERLAELASVAQSHLSRLERGERRLNMDLMRRLAAALDCAPADLIAAGARPLVPETLVVAAAHSEARPERLERAPPYEWQPARPGLAFPAQCFAATVADRSADRLGYPPGSLLIVRRLAALAAPLRPGDRVIAVRRDRHGEIVEAIAAIIDRTVDGDLVLLPRGNEPELPDYLALRRASGGGLGERGGARDDPIEYAPHADDAFEIVGRIEQEFTITR